MILRILQQTDLRVCCSIRFAAGLTKRHHCRIIKRHWCRFEKERAEYEEYFS